MCNTGDVDNFYFNKLNALSHSGDQLKGVFFRVKAVRGKAMSLKPRMYCLKYCAKPINC